MTVIVGDKLIVKCPEEFRAEFPHYPWFVPVQENPEDWDMQGYCSYDEFPEGTEVEVLDSMSYERKHGSLAGCDIHLFLIKGKNSAGQEVVGWATEHSLTA
jgi:hypothetical protein